MPRPADRLPDNAPGDWYVDRSCIDCGTCRRIAPATFADAGGHARVHAQPRDAAGTLRAGMALLACPVGAIGAPSRTDLRAARDAFPEEIAPGVLDVGYASRRARGAAAWLIHRADGNVLVDVPRYARPLLRRIDAMGGVRWIVLTHRGGAGEHAAWARHYGAARVIHRDELDESTAEAEQILTGPTRLAEDLEVLPVPGHTAGSIALLWRSEVLLAGAHLAADEAGRLCAPRAQEAWDARRQRDSIAALRDVPFTRVCPARGHAWSGDHDARRAAIDALCAPA
jgi:glyoxylase-like metal-dependent hydrolase (beta-lactamase superfamily II)/ferredoxin